MLPEVEIKPDSTIVLPSGNKIPLIGYGTYQLKGEDCVKGVQFALNSGYTHIDTASIYKNEAEIKEALKASGIARQKLFITSKISPAQQGYIESKEAVKKIIEQLGCGYLDLILIHWPGVGKLKPDDIKNSEIRLQTWKGFIELKEEKLVKDIGVSNFLKHHLQKLIQATGIKPAVNQFEIHPCLWEGPTINYCRQNKIAIEAYSPLARQADQLFKSKKINSIAEKHKKTVAQVSLRWCLQNNFIILPKSKTQSRIQENINIYDFSLDQQDMKLIQDLHKKNKRTCWDPNNVKY